MRSMGIGKEGIATSDIVTALTQGDRKDIGKDLRVFYRRSRIFTVY
jgi:hypothetical protein